MWTRDKVRDVGGAGPSVHAVCPLVGADVASVTALASSVNTVGCGGVGLRVPGTLGALPGNQRTGYVGSNLEGTYIVSNASASKYGWLGRSLEAHITCMLWPF